MKFVKQLQESIEKHTNQNVLCINGTLYTYKDFAQKISNIRAAVVDTIDDSEKLIGLVTNDDIHTYASIVALWLEGKAYVPVNPEVPFERNSTVFELTETKYILDSSEHTIYNRYEVIASNELSDVAIDLEPKTIDGDQLAYILFTSGTTGLPKGVPITFDNVQALVGAIDAEPTFNLTASDRCLQMFELTFDFSVVAYLFPLLAGSCLYTIPKGMIRYSCRME